MFFGGCFFVVLYKELREEKHKKGFISLKNCTRCTYLNDLKFKSVV